MSDPIVTEPDCLTTTLAVSSSSDDRADVYSHVENMSTKDKNAPPPTGWPRLAQKMVEKPELESFFRFRELNVKNLLYYQVEIAELEADLRAAEIADWKMHSSGKREEAFARGAYLMQRAQDEIDTPYEERRQFQLILKIRGRLKEYSKIERP